MEKSEISKIDEAFKAGKKVIVQTAPAVRAAIAEEFGEKIGTAGTGKMVAALHRLGFYRVFDTNFAADLTIMEEGYELIERIKHGGVLPQITSCSPGWVNYMEYFYPELIPHMSTCKSPHMMMGAIIKSYFAKKHEIDPKDIFVVSVMPCTAKKYEASREEMINDVDAVITTRELAKMIKRAGIVWNKLPEEQFDADLLGEYSGAGVIFGVTGGVMEAALRTAYFVLTGKEHAKVNFEEVRGLEGVREAEIKELGIKVAVASGMKNAKVLVDQIKAGTSPYTFIEIMGCPGGCINGGGQPYVHPTLLPNEDDDILDTYCQKRAAVLYSEDEKQVVRQSHNNPDIKKLYDDFLGHPLSETSEELLHTHYNAHREQYPDKK
jgi:NADP-reducing hydrogenase subunit HndD